MYNKNNLKICAQERNRTSMFRASNEGSTIELPRHAYSFALQSKAGTLMISHPFNDLTKQDINPIIYDIPLKVNEVQKDDYKFSPTHMIPARTQQAAQKIRYTIATALIISIARYI